MVNDILLDNRDASIASSHPIATTNQREPFITDRYRIVSASGTVYDYMNNVDNASYSWDSSRTIDATDDHFGLLVMPRWAEGGVESTQSTPTLTKGYAGM